MRPLVGKVNTAVLLAEYLGNSQSVRQAGDCFLILYSRIRQQFCLRKVTEKDVHFAQHVGLIRQE
jgi:hypothetical protein